MFHEKKVINTKKDEIKKIKKKYFKKNHSKKKIIKNNQKSTFALASVDLIRGVQKQRVNNKINLNRKKSSHISSKISWQGLNFRKHLKFIPEISKYALAISQTRYFECQVLKIIPEILKKHWKTAGKSLILGSTSNLSQRPQNIHLYRVSPVFNVKF